MLSDLSPMVTSPFYKVPISKPFVFMGKKKHRFSSDSIVDAYFKSLDSIHDPKLLVEVSAVKAKENFYRTYLRDSFRNTKGMQVDFIGQVHINATSSQLAPEVVYSQLQIKSILDSAKYDVIGWESSALDVLTPLSWMQESWAHIEYMGMQPDRDTMFFYNLKLSSVPDDAVLATWIERHDTHIIGNQNEELWTLNLATKKFYNFDHPFAAITMHMRSYMALARVLTDMKKHKHSHGVVVLGELHVEDFRFCADGLGLKMNIWSTLGDVDNF